MITRSRKAQSPDVQQQAPAEGWNRREFIQGVATATAMGGMMGPGVALAGDGHHRNKLRLPNTLQAPPEIHGDPTHEHYWAKVRRAFTLDQDYIHMNTGTTGSLPAFALANLAVYNLYKAQDPKDWEANLNADYPDLFPLGASVFGPSGLAARQQQVADAYNAASVSEVVLSYNTTDGCNLIFAGTPWQPGDRIVTTSFEHPALSGPIAWAQATRGVEVVTIDMGLVTPFTADITVQDVLDLFEPALAAPLPAGAKQYLAFSEIFYKNGLRLPVEDLCALARAYGAYSIVDTAHGFGMLPIDFQAYGADFMSGAGHKWLCGGPGTGNLYIRSTGTNLPPFDLGNFFLYAYVSPADMSVRAYDPSAWVQLRGENNRPALYAMTDSLALFQQVGIDAIYQRGVELGNYLKAKIEAQWPGALWVEAREPYSPFATALTAFNPFVGRDDSSAYEALHTAVSDVVDALAADDPKTYIRYTTWESSLAAAGDDRVGFRVSTHGVYNNYDEVDDMFDRLVYHVQQTGVPTI
ncbi:MAG: aminotransferase class V-fold PLP-dependent enzyme [Thiohalocapsa sp.]|jgi:selenocysteine lyase/cysteine desulfurase|uniref:aminotransferase class V-fold PLP-dependent enzyme n=1 Tax=Thiohalocapsa sp. TaxID=2497641 RepID=UPI0025F4EB74|nr:aminotransferase class V-fold PLP-dependent enzyme [Thiohalocapsa sp.]MCG6940572.1 aminotransferase class V-fold PLP-dependent enzyme [Thiohalocapsa sp.]